MSKKYPAKEFTVILLGSIDEALSSLGEDAKRSIYFCLEQKFALPKKEIPSRINDFSDALEQIFGLGSRHLELLIMRKIHEKVDFLYKWEGPRWLVPDLTFKRYVELMRLHCEDEERIGEVEVIVDEGEKKEQFI